MSAVEIHNLTFGYGRLPVLEEVSLKIETGEFVGLIGPNGGGKTTLLKLVMGEIKGEKGSVTLFGSAPHEAIGRVGYVPQTLSFDRKFPLSTLELVLGGRLAFTRWYAPYGKKNRAIAKEALKKVDLLEKGNHPVASLSGGELQRALIARALASKPKLLLLDEATAHVDLPTQTLIYNLLADLKGKITIVMVTHDLETAIHKVDRLICAQRTVSTLTKEKVCEHFAVGLYHPPLIQKDPS